MLGLADETSINQIEECNNISSPGLSTDENVSSQGNKGMPDSMFSDFIRGKLDHLDQKEREVMEPVLRRYKNARKAHA